MRADHGTEAAVGDRRSHARLNPAIDLTGPPLDPGISRLHAVLMATPDGGWAVVDPGSANGTEVNDAEIPVGQPIPLTGGDRVTLGAWTVITIRQR
jgi:pSer/pThr/pTyr-binding forkhead associated (FHA) protein